MPQRSRPDVRRVWSDTPEDVPTAPEPMDLVDDGPVRIRLSTSGRRGKAVTVISGLPATERSAIAKRLRKACGTGGSVKGDDVEIQGDHRDAIATRLGDRFDLRVN